LLAAASYDVNGESGANIPELPHSTS